MAQSSFKDAIDDAFGENSTNDDCSASIFAGSEGLELDGDYNLIAGEEEYSISKVTGTMINNSDKAYNSPSVKFKAWDKDGNILDDCSAYLSLTLGVGEKASFEATCGDFASDIKVYKVELKEFSHF